MTTAVFSLGLLPKRSFSNENGGLAARLRDAIVVVAPPGRALMALALGFALLSSGCAGQNIRSETWRSNPAIHVLAANPESPILRVSKTVFFFTRTPATAQEENTQAPALAFAGMQSNVRSDSRIAPLLETRIAPDGAGLSGGHKELFEDSRISGIVDSQTLQKLARAAETDYPMQPKLGGFRLDAEYTKHSSGGLPARAWSMGLSSTKLFMEGDHATLIVYPPMKSDKVVQKVVGTIFQSQDYGGFATDLQALTLIARRRINTEFSYSTQINKYSKFDATVIYRLYAHTDSGKSDLLLGLYYKAAF